MVENTAGDPVIEKLCHFFHATATSLRGIILIRRPLAGHCAPLGGRVVSDPGPKLPSNLVHCRDPLVSQFVSAFSTTGANTSQK